MKFFTVKIIKWVKGIFVFKNFDFCFFFWLHCSTSDEFKVSFIRDTKVLYCLLRITFYCVFFTFFLLWNIFPFSWNNSRMNFSRTWEQILIFRYTFHHTFSIEKLKNILFSLIKVSSSIFISFHFFKCAKNPKVNFDVSEYFVVKGFPCFNDFFFFFITMTIKNNEFLLIKVPNFFQQ